MPSIHWEAWMIISCFIVLIAVSDFAHIKEVMRVLRPFYQGTKAIIKEATAEYFHPLIWIWSLINKIFIIPGDLIWELTWKRKWPRWLKRLGIPVLIGEPIILMFYHGWFGPLLGILWLIISAVLWLGLYITLAIKINFFLWLLGSFTVVSLVFYFHIIWRVYICKDSDLKVWYSMD